MRNRRLGAASGTPALPRVRGQQCLLRRPHGGPPCTACQDACPREALWVDAEHRLHLDEDACIGCGACAPACPSQAIVGGWVDGDAVRRAARGAEEVAIGCRRGGDGGPGGDVTVPCLAALHPELLATLLLEAPGTTLALRLDRCDGCRIERLRPRIEAAVDRVVAFLDAIGAEANVRIDRDGGDAGAPAPRVSRRALFGLARDRAAATVLNELVTADEAEAPALPYRGELRAAVRRRVAGDAGSAVAGAGEVRDVDDAAFWRDWAVSERCDGCAGSSGHPPRCVAACPNGAWRLERSGDEATLAFDAARCTACGACPRACPQQAISARAAAPSPDDGWTAERTIALARCRACRTRIPEGGDGLCANCRKRESARLGRPA